ncbi:MAG: hypothetical protein ABL903_16555 [Methylococcales bacterium]
MKNTLLKKIVLSAVILFGAGSAPIALAHQSGAVPIGDDATATDLAAVQCYDDGGGAPDRLTVSIEDVSAPVPGLLVNMQVFKNNKMNNITDTVSGDGNSSPAITLVGGDGEYRISVNKTGAGSRAFNATWHCETSGGVHTGTDITVLQAQ